MRLAPYLLAGPLAFFAAGFLWTLGTDAGNRVIIKRQRAKRDAHRREAERALAAEAMYPKRERSNPMQEEGSELVFFGRAGSARWTVQ